MEPAVFDMLPISFDDFLFVIKGFYLLGMLLYIVFAGLIIRQVQMMTQSLAGILKLPLVPVAWVHFVIAILLFILAAVLL